MQNNQVYELQEFFLVTEVFDNPKTRPNDDYNTAKFKPDGAIGYENIEFPTHNDCLDYMRNRDKPNVAFQIQKLYRRVASTNPAFIMLHTNENTEGRV